MRLQKMLNNSSNCFNFFANLIVFCVYNSCSIIDKTIGDMPYILSC